MQSQARAQGCASQSKLAQQHGEGTPASKKGGIGYPLLQTPDCASRNFPEKVLFKHLPCSCHHDICIPSNQTTETKMFMKKSSLIIGAASCAAVCLSLVAPTAVMAVDTITPFGVLNTDITVDNTDSANTSLTSVTWNSVAYDNSVLIFGNTERYYNLTAGGTAPWLPEGSTFPADGTGLPGGPKQFDLGSKANNVNWTVGGGLVMSSADGLPFQQTLFAFPVREIFVFERGGNDNGTIQALTTSDGLTLGSEVTLTAGNGNSYQTTTISASGQTVMGFVFQSDTDIWGLRINSNGFDALTVTALPEPTTLSLLGLGLAGLLIARRRNR